MIFTPHRLLLPTAALLPSAFQAPRQLLAHEDAEVIVRLFGVRQQRIRLVPRGAREVHRARHVAVQPEPREGHGAVRQVRAQLDELLLDGAQDLSNSG